MEPEEADVMTFRTIICLNVEGVTFKSVLYQGYYVASHDRHMIFPSKPNPHMSYFYMNIITIWQHIIFFC